MVIDRKGLIFLGIVLCFIMGFFLLLGGVSLSRQQVNYIFGPGIQSKFVTANYDLPLPRPSSISTEQDQVRLDLERITVHKYYIVYSVIYGDQSHTAYHLYLTNLQRKNLDMTKLENIWLETDQGEKIEQIAEPTIFDFPKDQPLGWKVGIIAKFPYRKSRELHRLYFCYDGKTFELKDIQY